MLNDEVSGELNVVPFIDVVLVLMVIFMVTSQTDTMKSHVDVDLPKIGEPVVSASTKVVMDSLIISVNGSGIYLTSSEMSVVDKKISNVSTLVALTKKIVSAKSGTKVMLRADQTIQYGEVMKVMGALSKGGVDGVSLVLEGV